MPLLANRSALPDSLITEDKVYEFTFSDTPLAERIMMELRKKGKQATHELDITEGDLYYNTGRFIIAASFYKNALAAKAVKRDEQMTMKLLHRLISCYDGLYDEKRKAELKLRFYPRPDFINEALPGFLLFLLLPGVPCPQAQKAQHVHLVNFLHAPAVLHQFVVGGVHIFRQRQASCGIVTSGFSASARICSASCTAGIVGKVSSTSVVWVWVAISASAMSCIRRSAG